MVWPFKWNLFSTTFTWYYLFILRFLLSSLWMKSYRVTIQMKHLQQYFHIVLFTIVFLIGTQGGSTDFLGGIPPKFEH